MGEGGVGEGRRAGDGGLPTAPPSGARPPRTEPGVLPVDVDGVAAVTAGTGAWALAGIVLAALGADQEVLLTCAAGTGLGVVGVAYCLHRRTAIRRDRSRAAHEAAATPREPLT